jgi:hypothetical protein
MRYEYASIEVTQHQGYSSEPSASNEASQSISAPRPLPCPDVAEGAPISEHLERLGSEGWRVVGFEPHEGPWPRGRLILVRLVS